MHSVYPKVRRNDAHRVLLEEQVMQRNAVVNVTLSQLVWNRVRASNSQCEFISFGFSTVFTYQVKVTYFVASV